MAKKSSFKTMVAALVSGVKKYLFIYLFLSLIFLGHYFIAGQAVYGDGIDYWSYLHTWYFDKNTDFTNEYKHLYRPEFNNAHPEAFSSVIQKTKITEKGFTDNIHPPGTSIFMFPFYVLAHFINSLLNMWGLGWLNNGYSDIYQVTVGLGIVFYMTLATYLTKRLVRKLTGNENISWLSALAILTASPLLYYGGYDVINSHFASYLITVTFWLMFFTADLNKRKWQIILGLIVGLATLVRVQDILLAVPLIWRLRDKPYAILGSGLVGFLVIMPQMWDWYRLYGTPWPQTYVTAGIYPDFLGSIFNPLTGLVRTPIVILALSVMFWIRKPWMNYFLSFLIPTYILISLQGGWSASAYGGRMYISNLPFVAVLLSLLLSKIKPQLTKAIILIFFIINVLSIGSFVLLEKEVNSGKRRGLEEHTIIKLQQRFPFLK